MRILVPRPSGSWKQWNSQPLSSTTPTEETSTSKAGSVTKGRWRLDNEEPGGGKCRGRPLEGNRYVGLALTSDHRCGSGLLPARPHMGHFPWTGRCGAFCSAFRDAGKPVLCHTGPVLACRRIVPCLQWCPHSAF